MAFNLVYGNVFDYKADAFVLPANPHPVIGSGLDQYVYKKAGRNRLLKARQSIGEIEYGEVGVTPAYDFMQAQYIVHAASPRWIDGKQGERQLLEDCYDASLKVAIDRRCKSIVFPLLSSGRQKFPYDVAVEIAKKKCEEYAEHIDITLVIYSEKIEKAKNPYTGVYTYILEHTYDDIKRVRIEYEKNKVLWGSLPPEREERQNLEAMYRRLLNYKRELDFKREFEEHQKSSKPRYYMMENYYHSGKEFLASLNDKYSIPKSLGEVLDEYIDAKKLKNRTELCEKACISKDKFSRAVSGKRPMSREMLWKIAITLQLNMTETEELFKAANEEIYTTYRLTNDDITRELIIRYCIDEKFGNLDEVNYFLMDNDYEPLCENE